MNSVFQASEIVFSRLFGLQACSWFHQKAIKNSCNNFVFHLKLCHIFVYCNWLIDISQDYQSRYQSGKWFEWQMINLTNDFDKDIWIAWYYFSQLFLKKLYWEIFLEDCFSQKNFINFSCIGSFEKARASSELDIWQRSAT